jgi:nicotinate-nucleotide adenylyltransferase
MRIGLFGGSFDPVHCGHLLLAECCREQCRLDAVWFLPAARPPHKQNQELTPAEHRIAMLELAVAGNPAFSVCRYETQRDGISYTVDTL